MSKKIKKNKNIKNKKSIREKHYPFFTQLLKIKNSYEYFEHIDWLLIDKDYSSININLKNNYFEVIIKKLKFTEAENYFIGVKSDEFKNNSNQLIFQDGKKNDKFKLFMKHIRNSIAHAHIKIRTIKKEKYIEGYDFESNGNIQTAYFLMPLNYLLTIDKFCANKKIFL